MNPGTSKVALGVSTRSVADDGAEARLNLEVLPVLRAVREVVNQLAGELATATASLTLDPKTGFLLVDATLAPVTVTLPVASAVARPIVVMKIDASGNAVTVTLANGGTVVIAAQYAGRVFASDLVNFWSPNL